MTATDTTVPRSVPTLAGRRVVIPGGTGGVGEGAVRAWLQAGAEVVVPTRNAARGAELRRMLGRDGDRKSLHIMEIEYDTFGAAERLAAAVREAYGEVTDVVASVGGWWSGDGIWAVTESDWQRFFLELVTTHVALLRAFVPGLPTGGTYSLVLGGSAFTPVPGSAIISMEQAALRMMRTVVAAEAEGRVGVHGLLLGPVATRHRPYVDADMITADEVGRVTVGYAAAAANASSEAVLRTHADVARELERVGYPPHLIADASSGPVRPGVPPTRAEAAWPPLPAELEALTLNASDALYPSVRSSYMRQGAPRAVIRPQNDEDAAAALAYTAQVRREAGDDVPLSVRSGGHGIAGTSTNDAGIIIDLGRLNAVDLRDPASGLLRVQGGARWGDVAKVLTPHDLALTTGNFGDTGVGGLATAGGHGYFARSQGMTLDYVRRVKLLTADGNVRWVDAEHEPELFWAVRGGGTQVGIALEFEFDVPRLHSNGGRANIIHQEIQYAVADLPDFVEAWGQWMREAPREAVSFLMLQRGRAGEFVVAGRTVWAGDDIGAATPTLLAARELGAVVHESVQALSYPQIIPTPHSQHTGQQRIQMRNALVDTVNRAAGEALESALMHPVTAIGELRALGGAVSDVPREATAWAARDQEALLGIWANPAPLGVIDTAFSELQGLATGMYGAYSSDTRAAAARLAWPGGTGERLRAAAVRADPEHLFDRGLTVREA